MTHAEKFAMLAGMFDALDPHGELVTISPDQVKVLAAALRLAARSSWKSIDSAPKDGAWVLLNGGELGDQRGEDGFGKHPVVAKWVEKDHLTGWLVADFDDGYGLGVYYKAPTHWMLVQPLADMVVAA